jgi:hypothetical protein
VIKLACMRVMMRLMMRLIMRVVLKLVCLRVVLKTACVPARGEQKVALSAGNQPSVEMGMKERR